MSSKYNSKDLLNYINNLKDKIRDHKVINKLLDEWGIDKSVIDLIPIAFKDLEVSGRTDHGIIYLNYDVLDKDEDIDNDHYLVHEITHYFQQCYGDKPTKPAEKGKYLDDENEQESFQNQTEYIADEYGEDEARKYVEKVLDTHNIDDEKEREEKTDLLLSIAKLRLARRK
jgi:hypothetical protein